MVWIQWGLGFPGVTSLRSSGWHGAREPFRGGEVRLVHLGILWLAYELARTAGSLWSTAHAILYQVL